MLASAEAAWPLARGNPSAYAGALSRAWVWLALCAAFLLPFARRPARIIQLDLAVLVLGLSVSYAAWARGNLGLSVPLVYPVLAYLLARLLWIGLRPAPPAVGPLRLSGGALQLGLLFLLAFRVTLNVVDGIVIDVGRASVIGANHLLAGRSALRRGVPAADPARRHVRPRHVPRLPAVRGLLGDDAAAHIAAIAFDLAAAIGGLYLAGGALPAYLWAACPLTALALNASTNDALVGALILAAWLAGVRGRPAARGALTALAGLAKLAPLALAPAVRGTLPRPPRSPRPSPPPPCSCRVALGPGLGALLGPHGRLPARPQLAVLALGRAPAARLAAGDRRRSPRRARARRRVRPARPARASPRWAPPCWSRCSSRRSTGSTTTSPGSCRSRCSRLTPRGRRTGSIAVARPSGAAPDQHRVDPGVLVRGVVAHAACACA